MLVRPIVQSDWPAIMEIQTQCYLELTPESLAVMQSKWLLSPDTCLVFEKQNTILAYVLTHPWQYGDAPSLGTELTSINSSNCLYLHDMAISPNSQKMGLGKQLFEQIVIRAKQGNYSGIGLVAVQGAQTYWQRQGFRPNSPSKKLTLSSYPTGACYLYLSLS